MLKTKYVNSTLYREMLYQKFQKRIVYNPSLDITLVSFQANKHTPFYSWFKYKEGFSQRLVTYLLNHLWEHPPGVLLDLFAGSRSALFAAKELGWDTHGIEVLPVGIYAIQSRLASSRIDISLFEKNISTLKTVDFLSYYDESYAFEHISITKGAFLAEEEKQLIGYISYALELVYLGCKDADVKRLRQKMLSCTVENKDKKIQLQEHYSKLGRRVEFDLINQTFEQQAALHEVLNILEDYRDKQQLNNKQIVRLLRNYFYEMCFVIFELSRIIRQGGIIVMVNDNVQYAGEEVPVDLILSNIAESFGLTTRYIWTLGRGKGNSSQQMGDHGRSELRKCIYIWGKNKYC